MSELPQSESVSQSVRCLRWGETVAVRFTITENRSRLKIARLAVVKEPLDRLIDVAAIVNLGVARMGSGNAYAKCESFPL